ncbi:hypothetical protein [Nitrospirillum pindoramense]|uniref:RNase H superfamily protein n=1 Tax=Nitrospirillum amazonense TaxID=28077 RepID=A0A560H804_9PROT|nr:hypothetical protein [Nitrospirillum amazonense]TWB41939.1 hypothetical protein FBZ90_107318 [Nitrospirillum amazonense]
MVNERRSDGIPTLTPPVKIIIDSSSDNSRAAYVALVVDGTAKPRLIYGTRVGGGPSTSAVEWWGIKAALRRTNRRYAGQRPIIVYTDNLGTAQTRGDVHTQFQWVPRTDKLMGHLHTAANALRRSLELAERVGESSCGPVGRVPLPRVLEGS